MTATTPKRVAGLGVAIVVAIALDAAIAAVAHAAGASHAFSPLRPPSYTSLTVIGMLAGAAGWAVVRARAADPRRVLGRLVPVVLAVSLVPDVIVGTSSVRGASWGAVAALMVMHVVVATVLVAALLRELPLPDNGGPHIR